tara:strand:+ start:1969 stop:3141 length:1173 start_codon:yes stop_codon:yes gene_type:complete
MVHMDVIIIGAGPAGLSLANSLANINLKVLVVEKQSKKKIANPDYDGREIALTHFSKKILKEIDIWKYFSDNDISSIKEAKVLDGNSPYALHFDRKAVSTEALGYIISNQKIKKALYNKLIKQKNIEIIYETEIQKILFKDQSSVIKLSNNKVLRTSLLIAADSRFSKTREMAGISTQFNDFKRVAIVARMRHEKPHNNIAYECFHYGETLAILPLNKNISSIVMTIPKDKSSMFLSINKNQFNKYISDKFKNKFGKMNLIDKRFSYPLVSVFADKFVSNNFALIGDAAVGMHPVTAHGFNLGLRGQHALYKQIKQAVNLGLNIGSPVILEKYQLKHYRSCKPLYLATNSIVKLYTDESMISKIARKAVLRIGNNFFLAKQQIINQLTEI